MNFWFTPRKKEKNEEQSRIFFLLYISFVFGNGMDWGGEIEARF